jgi:galactokinase
MSSLVNDLVAAFRAEHGREPRVFSAPGRVNWIGEHTDYNDGFVLPVAIERRTYVAAAPRADRRLGVFAQDLGARATTSLDEPAPAGATGFMAYIDGVARTLEARGTPLVGADLVVRSEVPIGAGLSSSAALEVAVGFALAELSGADLPPLQLALAAQAAEHRYAGTRCGIMDQYIAALGRPGHALLIDCRSLVATSIPLALGSAALLICDSRVKHTLATSAYNDRRAECERGVAWFARAAPEVRALRDVTLDQLESCRSELPSVTYRRCRHVVSENARTLAAVEALAAGDLAAVGRLMLASHASLRDDYEVSIPELDLLVEAAAAQPGVHGARLTGAGFGGCVLVLVEAAAAEAVAAALVAAGTAGPGPTPTVFTTRAAGGVRAE